ncbi:metal-sensing transcriptional repressor [Bacillus sp. 31A1R]|uniref:Metal-sensing transcriptional repressor n=1 Tax=Robertmurraya mangrovi TaxID=3098077 RepID=A0ABU5J3L1_9BACI|nr:metal-sensing transcriptional repressor [Bacillus sp. 31A1R]MDZ5473932.1 metal-sensing transcriptional repressor [Bacillus sp. 31A1R]
MSTATLTNKTPEVRSKLFIQLNHIERQIREIRTLIKDENLYYEQVLAQITSSKGTLEEVSKLVVEEYFRNDILKHRDDAIALDEVLLLLDKIFDK